MFNGEIYLSVEDLMRLMGINSRPYAYSKHKKLRHEIRPQKGSLLISEFCELTGDDYREVFRFLRGKDPP